MSAITLNDVYAALDEGQPKLAFKNLQEVLAANPSADAWYLAAELTLDRDREKAIRHLKRALLLNPRHGQSLTLLGQLGEDRDLTLHDVAEEISETVGEHADKTPLLRRLSRPQQMIVIGIMAVLLTVATVFGLNALLQLAFQPDGPKNLSAEAPAPAAPVVLVDAPTAFEIFTTTDRFPIQDVERESASLHDGKQTLRFNVQTALGAQPVEVIVYRSVGDLIQDSGTHQQLERNHVIHVSQNVLLAYSSSLAGQYVEQDLINLLSVITGK